VGAPGPAAPPRATPAPWVRCPPPVSNLLFPGPVTPCADNPLIPPVFFVLCPANFFSVPGFSPRENALLFFFRDRNRMEGPATLQLPLHGRFSQQPVPQADRADLERPDKLSRGIRTGLCGARSRNCPPFEYSPIDVPAIRSSRTAWLCPRPLVRAPVILRDKRPTPRCVSSPIYNSPCCRVLPESPRWPPGVLQVRRQISIKWVPRCFWGHQPLCPNREAGLSDQGSAQSPYPFPCAGGPLNSLPPGYPRPPPCFSLRLRHGKAAPAQHFLHAKWRRRRQPWFPAALLRHAMTPGLPDL